MNRMTQFLAAGAILLATASSASAVSPSAYRLFDSETIPFTNSMLMSWVISAAIIFGIRWLVGKPQLVPSRGQAVVEEGLGTLRGMFEPIVGRHMVGPTLPYLLGLFFFILFHNWSGLLPGVGVFGTIDEAGKFTYWMRPGNADMNMTLALGLIGATFGWGYFALRYAGIKTILYDIFGNKADRKDVGSFIWILLIPIFLLVGMIEMFSIALRNVSLSVRLFGNVYGGESLIVSLTNTFPHILLPVPFYFLEMLIGLVQALVFTLLSAVYIGLICNHGDDHEAAH